MKKKSDEFYISPYQEVDIIYIPFPKKKYKKLLETCHITKASEVGTHQVGQLFVNSIYWFLRGELSLENLSMIIAEITGYIKGSDQHGELDHALEAGDELAYYIRRMYYPNQTREERSHVENRFSYGIKGIMDYYMNHKELIVTLPKPKWATFAD